MDQGPVTDSETVIYSYNYGASFEADDSSHIGLGFHVESEESPSIIGATPVTEKVEYSRFDSSSAHEMETDMMDDDGNGSSSPVTNSGFLSIGGVKLYTHDISCDDDDEEDDGDDEEGEEESSDSEDSCESSDSDGAYNSDSEIDDELAQDYFEGIGGSYKVANVDQLIGQILDSSDDDEEDFSGGRFGEMLEGVSGIQLQDASREHGMKKPRSKNKSRAKPGKFGAATDDWSTIDDLMLVKNSRSLYGKKKHAPKLPQSWPSKAEKSKNFRRFSGEKKKLRQDRIASKRKERMIRGVDLEKINYKLEQMVKNKGDIMSFQLMHSRDCSQVQRLAAIYHLHSGSQGSGKKRFVTVTRTQHTRMPSSSDRIRLEMLLRINDEANDTPVCKTPSNRIKNSGLNPLDPKSAKSNDSSKKKRRDKDKTGSYAAQPVSFISSGNMVTESEKTVVVDHQTLNNNKVVANSSNYGAFEMHTTGFGSRMMAKMGFVDGGGLGKDGGGISEPIEVIQRPKSLGLGAKIPETSEPVNATPPPQKPNRQGGQGSRGSESRGKSGNVHFGSFEKHTKGFGSFEKHTKGFGSKMMAKMGFVEGMGLGRDSQGMVQPLVASRLPKSRGLGARG
ncbi:putative G-patch domain, R3H domain, R3H domain superfamily protein [Helianthus annuus]|nr:putative G-patch domain, R3H domain, R3H domain superfamily protein [Helianthus annuus]